MPMGLIISYLIAVIYPFVKGEGSAIELGTYSPILLGFFAAFFVGLATGIGFFVPNYLRIRKGV
jgi:hypothetical protein